jgi:hypothetical protein
MYRNIHILEITRSSLKWPAGYPACIIVLSQSLQANSNDHGTLLVPIPYLLTFGDRFPMDYRHRVSDTHTSNLSLEAGYHDMRNVIISRLCQESFGISPLPSMSFELHCSLITPILGAIPSGLHIALLKHHNKVIIIFALDFMLQNLSS